MIGVLEQALRAHWSALAPRRPPPHRLHFLKFGWSDHPHPTQALLFLVFADSSARPIAVVKAARVAEGDACVGAEFDNLQRAHCVLPQRLGRIVPVPVIAGEVNGRAFFVSTALPGEVELHNAWGSRRARRCVARMRAALSWAREVRHATLDGRTGLREWLGVESPDVILAALARRGWADAQLSRVEPRVRAASAERWPASFAHGDFFPGNVLFQGRRRLSGVIDWTFSHPRAPVFVDPLMYELSFSLQALQRGGTVDAREIAAVHALAPFAECRRELSESGVNLELGGASRCALLLAGCLDAAANRPGHADATGAYARLLQIEANY